MTKASMRAKHPFYRSNQQKRYWQRNTCRHRRLTDDALLHGEGAEVVHGAPTTIEILQGFMDFPVVVYASEADDIGPVTAHSLLMDLIADGDTADAAIAALNETIDAAFEATEKHEADPFLYANPFHRAPQKYWDMPR